MDIDAVRNIVLEHIYISRENKKISTGASSDSHIAPSHDLTELLLKDLYALLTPDVAIQVS
jgi:hypothetical protein